VRRHQPYPLTVSEITEPAADEMAVAFVAAFPHYLRTMVTGLGLSVDDAISGVIEAATADLSSALETMLAAPHADQRRSPLELVRTATHRLTRALDAAGAPPVARDGDDVEIHPEDIYNLYPASSRDLGEEAWRAHIQWGVAKARTVAGVVPAGAEARHAGRVVALFGIPLERRDEFVSTIGLLGYTPVLWRNPAALAEGIDTEPALVVVDSGHPKARDAIRDLADRGTRVIAAGEHVDDLETAALMSLGAEQVVELHGLAGRLHTLLPSIV
jgi:hypothetical protein